MKLKYQFVVQSVGGRPMAVAVGQDSGKFNGMIKLNESGALIFKLLSSGDYTEAEILTQFATHFDVPEDSIKADVLAFIDQLRQNDLLSE